MKNHEFDRLEKAWKSSQAESAKFLAKLPATSACPLHPEIDRCRDDHKSLIHKQVVFQTCPACEAAIQTQREIDRLQKFGVPLSLCNATFENWNAADEQAEANCAAVRDFTIARRGFLVLLGDLGTGKTHLSVAVLRTFKNGLFVKQSELLRRLRQTYRDRAAIDPVEQAQDTECLVLDEIGLSAGGRDELPLLHDVLDYRHGNQKPTILTGNLTFAELGKVIGDRMSDRLRESNFATLIFGGYSHRRSARTKYFQKKCNLLFS